MPGVCEFSFLPLSLLCETKREIRRWMCVCVNRLAIVNHDNSRYIIRLAPINRLENAIFHIFGGRKSFGGRRIEFCTRDITCFSSSRSLLFFFFLYVSFSLFHSRRECVPRHAAPVRRLLVLLPHRRESGHRVSCVHQVRRN